MSIHTILIINIITIITITIILNLQITQIHSKIINPPNQYTIEHLFKIANKQKLFVLDSYQIRDAYVNPSIIQDDSDDDKFIMVIL